MIDREKVIKGLKCCAGTNEGKTCIYIATANDCPYEDLCGEYEDAYYKCTTALATDAIELLKEQEQIVRCKDCKHSVNYSAVFHVRPYKCEKHIWSREADWFCADGERR